jgi:DHA1 family bicyclomycin/chloramphenicol resistance-like MFS transporter
MVVIGLAPILAPVIGGQLLHVTDWRGIFIALGAGGALLLAVCVRGLPETLPVSLRHHGGGAASMRVMSGLLRDRRFAGLTVIQGLFFAALFSYIAGSSFALENVFGVSPQLFGVIFGVNALGLVCSSQVGARYVGRLGPRRLATIGLCGSAVTGVVLIVAILAHAGLWIVLPCFFSLMVNYGLVGPNLTALAMAIHPRSAGGASALIGSIQFTAGAAVAPLVGLAGTHSAVPMGVLIAASVLVSLGVWRVWEAGK